MQRRGDPIQENPWGIGAKESARNLGTAKGLEEKRPKQGAERVFYVLDKSEHNLDPVHWPELQWL